MARQSDFARYNDGVVRIYKDTTERSSFAAKQNARGLDDLELVIKLDFEEMSKRQQDQDFAEQNGFSLSMKIRTRLAPGLDSKHKAVIGDTLYDISHLDKSRTEAFLYLEEVRKIDS